MRSWRLESCLQVLVACLSCGGGFSQGVAAETANPEYPEVVSINLCADQLVLLLADPEQILALSALSHEEGGSVFHQQAQAYPQITPTAEDILQFAPDIVLTGPYTQRYTRALLDDLGLKTHSLAVTETLEQMLENLEQVGRLLGQTARAGKIRQEVLARLRQFEQRVSTVRKSGRVRPRAAVYDPNGYTVGDQTIRGEVMKYAGWHNVALDMGIRSYGTLSVEDLIRLQPEVIIESPYSEGTYSRAQQVSRHPALRQSGLNADIIKLPSNLTICAGPWTLDAIETLLNAPLGSGLASQ